MDSSADVEYTLKASYLEVYNEKVWNSAECDTLSKNLKESIIIDIFLFFPEERWPPAR